MLHNALQFQRGRLVFKVIHCNWESGFNVRKLCVEASETPSTAKELSYSNGGGLQQNLLVWGSSGDPHYHTGWQQLWKRQSQTI